MTLAENYLIWKAPKNLVLDSGFEPQIIVDLRLRIQEFTGQGSAGASQGLFSLLSFFILPINDMVIKRAPSPPVSTTSRS